MADRVVLHVGAMKSGTTSLQALLFENRSALAEQGLLVPGETWGDQARAVTEVARTWRADGARWSALVAEIRDWPGPAVVSMEYLGPFDPPQIDAVVSTLRGAPVEVVLTVRDLNRSLVSMWQETVQNGRSWTWADYLSAARRSRPRRWAPREVPEAGRTFWRQQDMVGMVRRWGEAVGPDAVSLVTVPPPGAERDELTRRFARAVGFSAAGLVPGEAANASLGLVSAVLLQRTNAVLEAEGVSLGDGKRFRKRVVAKQVLGARAALEPRIGLPVARWVRSHAQGTTRRLGAEVHRIEGAWSDLTPVEVTGEDPGAVDDGALTTAACEAFAELRDHLVREGLGGGVEGLPEWPSGAVGEGAVAAFARLVAVGVRAGAQG